MCYRQLSQSPLEKRPSYDAIQGANVNPTTFYNIGDLEVQDSLACIWYRLQFQNLVPFLFLLALTLCILIFHLFRILKMDIFMISAHESDKNRVDIGTIDFGCSRYPPGVTAIIQVDIYCFTVSHSF